MKLLIFGATGMVGQGVLREALRDPGVTAVTTVLRKPSGKRHQKLTEIVLADLFAFETIAARLAGHEACIYCVGVSSVGMSEADYTRATYDLALAVARPLAASDPATTFVFVSGGSTDGSGTGRVMWARVKGRTENALRALPFKAVYCVRPGAIQPLHGIRSRTGWYNTLYALTAPLYPLLLRLFPGAVTSSEQLGRALIHVAREGYSKPILENADINAMT